MSISKHSCYKLKSGKVTPFVCLFRFWDIAPLCGCGVDIKVLGTEQLIRYANILLDYADESRQDFDELLIEKNRYGAIWLHFAVRPFSNRRHVNILSA